MGTLLYWQATIPKKALLMAYFASEGFDLVSPPDCGEIALENSVVHCIAAHPSYPQTVAHYTEAMAHLRSILRRWLQQMPYRQRSPSRFCFHFSFFIFSLVGKCNEMMT